MRCLSLGRESPENVLVCWLVNGADRLIENPISFFPGGGRAVCQGMNGKMRLLYSFIIS